VSQQQVQKKKKARTFFKMIFVEHYSSMHPLWFVFLHFISFAACVPILFGFRLTVEQNGAVITAVSIYSALLFGTLIPAGDQANRLKNMLDRLPSGNLPEMELRAAVADHRAAARQLLANVAFSIIVSVTDVLLLIVTLCLAPGKGIPEPAIRPYIMAAAAYLFLFLLLQLIVIVRTVYASWMVESQ
jgi:hypothetical protein